MLSFWPEKKINNNKVGKQMKKADDYDRYLRGDSTPKKVPQHSEHAALRAEGSQKVSNKRPISHVLGIQLHEWNLAAA